MQDPNTLKPTWGGLYFTGILCVFGGFLLGWVTNSNSDAQVYALIVGICLIWAIKIARSFYNEQLLAFGIIFDNYKEENNSSKSESSSVVFDNTDFTDDANNILIPIVSKCKKQKVKVSGQGLISAILKGIR